MQKYQHYIFATLLACAAAGADAQETTPSVEVQGVKNPDMRSYRAVVAGLDAFDKHHALAPAVPELRFRLAPRSGSEAENASAAAADPLYLRIVGNGEPIPIPVAADGTFSVPRVESAIDDDADLILNRKKGVLKGRPEVRTPGLPDNVRRLGDLRLECQVMVAVAKKEVGLMLTLLVNTLAMTTNWCDITVDKKKVSFSFASLRMLDGAQIVDGERRVTLETHDFSFMAPIADASWSHDARIELRYAPELSEEEKANPWLQTLFVSGSINDGDLRQPLRRQEDGIYRVELDLEKGSHSLKVGTRGLRAINLGTASEGDKRQLAEDVAAPLVQRGKSLKLKVEHAGRYAVTLDARDKEAPTLRVARLP